MYGGFSAYVLHRIRGGGRSADGPQPQAQGEAGIETQSQVLQEAEGQRQVFTQRRAEEHGGPDVAEV